MDIYGIIGNPVEHSLSPTLHEAAYDKRELDATYAIFEVNTNRLESAIQGAEALGIQGLNVTIPFKEDVLKYVQADQLAEQIGAVNTIDFATSPPTGYNTDAIGAKHALYYHDVEIPSQQFLVIGAGGAARAICYMLEREDASITIANRTFKRGKRLADELNSRAIKLEDVTEISQNVDILINATSVGMEENKSPVPPEALHSELTVMDIVYRPLKTKLIEDANASGAKTIDGAWMLLYQGAKSFEIWTEYEAPIDVMNAALRNYIEETSTTG
ncbi:MAG: shikimate dehydrogenase [Halobacteriaceae archaeon]